MTPYHAIFRLENSLLRVREVVETDKVCEVDVIKFTICARLTVRLLPTKTPSALRIRLPSELSVLKNFFNYHGVGLVRGHYIVFQIHAHLALTLITKALTLFANQIPSLGSTNYKLAAKMQLAN